MVAMAGKNCVAIGTDTRLGQQLMTVDTSFQRVFKVNDMTLMGLSGLATDVQTFNAQMKFRMNNDWGTNWGDDGVDGTLDAGGANIVVTAGIYIATVDMNDLTYTLEKIDHVWGLVGGAAPNGWNGPDAQFKRDWSKPFNNA